jgi:hypothetical protein
MTDFWERDEERLPRWKSLEMTFGSFTHWSRPLSGRMRWERARPFRQSESKIQAGNGLRNSERVPVLPQDDLEKRAEAEMRRWLRTLRQRDRGKFT